MGGGSLEKKIFPGYVIIQGICKTKYSFFKCLYFQSSLYSKILWPVTDHPVSFNSFQEKTCITVQKLRPDCL